MLDSLDHVIIGVRDLGEATLHYTELLGREPAWRGSHPEAGTSNTLFRLDNTYVELLTPGRGGPISDLLTAWLGERGEGLVALAFGTPDAVACHGTFTERGLEPEPMEQEHGESGATDAVRQWKRVPLPLATTRGVILFAVEHTSAPELLQHSPAIAADDEAVSGLDHVVVRTSDAAAARALYGDGLGLRLALDRTAEQWGMRMLFFRVGGVTVEVTAPLDETASSGDSAKPDELWGLCYRMPDARSARARLDAAGVDVSEVRAGRKPGTSVFTVRSKTCGVPTLMLEAPPRDGP